MLMREGQANKQNAIKGQQKNSHKNHLIFDGVTVIGNVPSITNSSFLKNQRKMPTR